MEKKHFRELIQPHLDKAFTGEDVKLKHWIHTVEGRIFVDIRYSPCFDENNKVIYVAISARDLTEQKLVEDALHQVEDKFSKLFQSSPNSIALLSIDDGRFMDINDMFIRASGYSRQYLVGKNSNGTWFVEK